MTIFLIFLIFICTLLCDEQAGCDKDVHACKQELLVKLHSHELVMHSTKLDQHCTASGYVLSNSEPSVLLNFAE